MRSYIDGNPIMWEGDGYYDAQEILEWGKNLAPNPLNCIRLHILLVQNHSPALLPVGGVFKVSVG